MKVLSGLDLSEKWIRHNVTYYCHNHPTQPDNFNAALKELVAALQGMEWPDVDGEQIATFGQQNLIISDGLATIVVTKVNDGAHDVEASDIYTHLFDSAHVHFTEGSIDHYNIQNVGEVDHDEIDDHVNNWLLHEHSYPFSAASITGVSLPAAALKEGLPAVGTDDPVNAPLYFKVSSDGDTFWRSATQRTYVLHFTYYDDAEGAFWLCYYNDSGEQTIWINKSGQNLWLCMKQIITARFNGAYPNGADLKITAGGATQAYTSGLRLIRQNRADNRFCYTNALYQASL
jgi:hypothetical protein